MVALALALSMLKTFSSPISTFLREVAVGSELGQTPHRSGLHLGLLGQVGTGLNNVSSVFFGFSIVLHIGAGAADSGREL